jgi:recombination protein RecT
MATLKETFQERVKAYGCKNEDLALNYYTRLDNELKKSTATKLWKDIAFDDFLAKSIAYANIGIDPLAPKMLSFTLFKNKSTLLFDIVFVEDVRCMELLARRFGVNCPENITVELIYSTDVFSMIKKDLSHPSEGYVLEVSNPFNRGEIIGGVSLMEYENPAYNKVRIMSMADITKRVKTTDYSGKETSFWKNFKPEMCEKTIGKNAWSKVVLNTTELSEYYAIKPSEDVKEDFEPESTTDLPFNPDAEL